MYDLAGRNPALRLSPYCWRARMALAHKGLEPRTIAWRFHEGDRLPGAPHNRQVPIIVDQGDIVAGSTTIALHLEDRHANGPSLFGGPGGEAHARFIMAWTDTVLTPGLFPIAAGHIHTHLHDDDQAYFRRSREQRLGMTLEEARETAESRLPALRASLEPLRRTLSQQAYLGGDEPSYADYAVFGSFQWVRVVGAPEILETDDPIYTWREAMLDLFGDLARRSPVAA